MKISSSISQLTLWVLSLGTIATVAADVTVSNVRAAQRPGTKLVDIYYDVTATTVGVEKRIGVSRKTIAPEERRPRRAKEGRERLRRRYGSESNRCNSLNV